MPANRRQFLVTASSFGIAAAAPVAAQGAEEKEERLFGEGGFERTVEQVTALERQLGIDDLSQFTAQWAR